MKGDQSPETREARNFDELLEMMSEDELLDALREKYIKPRDYARAKGINPQNVYYYIRTGKLTSMECPGNCGCRVIEVTEANEVIFGKERWAEDGTPIPNGDEDDWERT